MKNATQRCYEDYLRGVPVEVSAERHNLTVKHVMRVYSNIRDSRIREGRELSDEQIQRQNKAIERLSGSRVCEPFILLTNDDKVKEALDAMNVKRHTVRWWD